MNSRAIRVLWAARILWTTRILKIVAKDESEWKCSNSTHHNKTNDTVGKAGPIKSPNFSDTRCFNCGEIGHTSKYCISASHRVLSALQLWWIWPHFSRICPKKLVERNVSLSSTVTDMMVDIWRLHIQRTRWRRKRSQSFAGRCVRKSWKFDAGQRF